MSPEVVPVETPEEESEDDTIDTNQIRREREANALARKEARAAALETGEESELRQEKEDFLADYTKAVVGRYGETGEVKIRKPGTEDYVAVSMDRYGELIKNTVDRASREELAILKERAGEHFEGFGKKSETVGTNVEVIENGTNTVKSREEDDELTEEDFRRLEADDDLIDVAAERRNRGVTQPVELSEESLRRNEENLRDLQAAQEKRRRWAEERAKYQAETTSGGSEGERQEEVKEPAFETPIPEEALAEVGEIDEREQLIAQLKQLQAEYGRMRGSTEAQIRKARGLVDSAVEDEGVSDLLQRIEDQKRNIEKFQNEQATAGSGVSFEAGISEEDRLTAEALEGEESVDFEGEEKTREDLQKVGIKSGVLLRDRAGDTFLVRGVRSGHIEVVEGPYVRDSEGRGRAQIKVGELLDDSGQLVSGWIVES